MGCSWSELFGLILWQVWKARNNVVFNGAQFLPHEIIEGARFWLKEVVEAKASSLDDVCRREQVMIGWRFPPGGWVKGNVDGSVMHDSRRASCRGLGCLAA